MQLFHQRLWYQIIYIVCLWQVLSICNSIHNNVFSSYLKNGSSKLVCYITLGWKGLLEKNTLTYWAQMYFMRKMKCREYSPWIIPTGYSQGTHRVLTGYPHVYCAPPSMSWKNSWKHWHQGPILKNKLWLYFINVQNRLVCLSLASLSSQPCV